MRVLALDTALGATSVAIVDFPDCVTIAGHSEAMARGHAEALVPMVRDVMSSAGIGWDSLDRIVTTVGPGSFTGLRVAVAAARAFGVARRLPVVGVSTLTAYAAPLLAGGSRTAVASVIDARHGAVFFESFWGDGKVAAAPGLRTVEEAAAAIGAGRTRLVGNATGAVFALARKRGCDCEQAGDAPAPDIAFVARLGAAVDPAFAPALPLYLRNASATPQAHAAVARAAG